MTSTDVAGLAVHSAARRTLAALDEAELARGAANLATVAALTLAVTPAFDAADLEAAVTRLSRFVATVEPDRRAFAAATIDAAIGAQVQARMSRGLPPHARRLDGWTADGAATVDDPSLAGTLRLASIPPRALRRYESAAHADDLDAVLLAALPASRALAEAARKGLRLDVHLRHLTTHALALCVWPAPTAAEVAEVRPVASILERTLRRRHPIAAAVLVRRFSLDPGFADASN